jgi:glycosyltransferase involved in cell wall biosynthesis
VGIAFYNPEYGENFTLLASASGKMTHCLKYGLPVVVLDLPGFAEIIEKYQCGIVIKDLAEMNQAIETIRMNYPFYKENVMICYENEFAFDSFFKKALFALDHGQAVI